MATTSPRFATRSADSRVTTLELFFDLVFVLAIAQCTTLMSKDPTWTGLAHGIIVLGLLWWAWVAYAWLTSVLNPELVLVRLGILGAGVGLVVAAMSVPQAFGDLSLVFVIAYGIVRAAQLLLFWLAGASDTALRASVASLAVSSGIGLTLLVVGALQPTTMRQTIFWGVALAIDAIGPYLSGENGWKLVPGHFAERHGLIMIIALGETIVAIEVGASDPGATGVIVAAALGTIAASMLWWLYFDVLALVAEERLTQAPAGPVQNAMARDAYSYIHFLLVAGVVLLALGLKKTLAHVDEPLSTVGAVALCGGAALYIVGLMAFSKRTIRGIASDNYFIVALLIGLAWIGRDLAALEMLLALTIALVASVIFKATRYQNRRREVRRHMVGAGSEERDERTS